MHGDSRSLPVVVLEVYGHGKVLGDYGGWIYWGFTLAIASKIKYDM
jgi:hypothetical protein